MCLARPKKMRISPTPGCTSHRGVPLPRPCKVTAGLYIPAADGSRLAANLRIVGLSIIDAIATGLGGLSTLLTAEFIRRSSTELTPRSKRLVSIPMLDSGASRNSAKSREAYSLSLLWDVDVATPANLAGNCYLAPHR